MTRIRTTTTAFTAGELDPQLLGRIDLKAQASGAARLRNIIVEPTGGVTRRPGTAFVAAASGQGRLIACKGTPDEGDLLLLTDQQVVVYRGDTSIATLAAPWTADQLAEISWTQFESGVLLCHPDVQPQRIRRDSDGIWFISAWAFETEMPDPDGDPSDDPPVHQPYGKFVDPEVQLEATIVDAPSRLVSLAASAPVFVAQHVGTIFRMERREIQIAVVHSPTSASGNVRQPLNVLSSDPNRAGPTTDWDEAALSPVRGWARSATMHQNRLVIGGSRDLPNRVWMSKSGRPFNFDLGSGLDDEAIDFALTSDQSHTIRAVFPGRHLQVFTDAGEWVASGVPLTPGHLEIQQQTKIGSLPERWVPPCDVDGATLFIGRNGNEVREFLFADTEQAYQAADLALISRHLISGPVDQDFDQVRRQLLIVMDDGSLAAVTVDRNSDVVAWSRHETEGRFLAVAVNDESVWVLVERAGGVLLERFDETLMVDAGIKVSVATPQIIWSGLDHLEGAAVKVIADGAVYDDVFVGGGSITLDVPARSITAGLGYRHTVEALPPVIQARGGIGLAPVFRAFKLTFRLLSTGSFWIDSGRGPRNVPLGRLGGRLLDAGQTVYSGDLSLRTLGWGGGWRIEQDAPLPFTLLSVTSHIKVNV